MRKLALRSTLGRLPRLMLTAELLGPYGCNREDLARGGGRERLPETVVPAYCKKSPFRVIIVSLAEYAEPIGGFFAGSSLRGIIPLKSLKGEVRLCL